jgi:DNA-binding transcriptional LysR family regulator
MINIKTFDLNLLRVLDVLLEEAQVSAAARRLNLSQPATSAALARLRASLGDPLLVRSRNRMMRTALAEALRPRVRKVLAEVYETLSASRDFVLADSGRTFRIAANDYSEIAIVGPLLAHLKHKAPNLRLEILPFEEDFDRKLAEGDYDLAIRDEWAMRSWRHRERMFTETLVCIARRDHPRLSVKPSLDEFLAEGHVLISPAGTTPGIVDAALERINRRRRIMVTLPHFLAAPAIVAHTDHVMTIASRAAKFWADAHALRIFAPPLALRGFDLAMAWHPGVESDPAVSWLRAQLRGLMGALSRSGRRNGRSPAGP